MPTYTDFALLPDTIYKFQNLNLQVNGVSGADLVEIILEDGASVAQGHLINQSISPVSSNNTFTITAAATTSFTPYNSTHYYGSLQINIQKYNDQTISGKKFRFISQFQVSKNVYIK